MGSPGFQGAFVKREQTGVGMMEFLVALTVFTTVAVALLTTQVVGKRMQFDALQRSRAVEMANDMLTKIRSNSGAASAYFAQRIPDPNQPLSTPAVNCRASECSSEQLATFDLWQWERELSGALQQRSGRWTGGLLSPLACIRGKDGLITIVVSWQGMSRSTSSLQEHCAPGAAGVGSGGESATPGGAMRQRVVVSGQIGSHS